MDMPDTFDFNSVCHYTLDTIQGRNHFPRLAVLTESPTWCFAQIHSSSKISVAIYIFRYPADITIASPEVFASVVSETSPSSTPGPSGDIRIVQCSRVSDPVRGGLSSWHGPPYVLISILPIMLSVCELWGHRNIDVLERLFHDPCVYTLVGYNLG